MSRILTQEQKEQFITKGYTVARSAIPADVVSEVRAGILDALEIDAEDPSTWTREAVADATGVSLRLGQWSRRVSPLDIIKLTARCRPAILEDIAAELAGPYCMRGESYSPYLASIGVDPPYIGGYIPVLKFPEPGDPIFVTPGDYHIDGMSAVTLWPTKYILVMFAYLTDTARHGGATTVLPGSHRQIFEHCMVTGDPITLDPPNLAYADPVPLDGSAGDVIFMHYLLAHSGSDNRSQRIRVGLNAAVMPDPTHIYTHKAGPPKDEWTPLDWTLRTDNLPAG